MTVVERDPMGSPQLTRPAEGPTLGRVPVPVATADIELSHPLPSLGGEDSSTAGEEVEQPAAVLALIRLHRVPVGRCLLTLPGRGLPPDQLAEEIWRQAGPAIAAHACRDGLPVPRGLSTDGLRGSSQPRCLRRRSSILADAPHATVVIATRDRPEHLRRCLDSVLRIDYPSFDVVVVDNNPETDATAELIRSSFPAGLVTYVREDRRGLAAAHNRGVEVATGDILAFTDDDVVVDPDWLSALYEGFTMADGVAAVTGLIHPAELRTRAQVLLEQHGGFGKGFVPKVFDLDHRASDPLFPFRAGQLGSGANMAFDAAFLRGVGGFDPAMGTGTSAYGGDDLVALFSVVAAGHRIVYQPGAVIFHYHRDELPALARQAYGYGVGLGAFLTNVIVHHPGLSVRLARHAPAELSAAVRMGSDRNRARYDAWPAELARLERRGIVYGPVAYARSRWAARGAHRPRAER